jgi:hypothetical protein
MWEKVIIENGQYLNGLWSCNIRWDEVLCRRRRVRKRVSQRSHGKCNKIVGNTETEVIERKREENEKKKQKAEEKGRKSIEERGVVIN